MKHIVKQEPVDYIEFDNGAQIKFSKVLEELKNMEDTNWTEFYIENIKNEIDEKEEALFAFIKERLNKAVSEGDNVGYIDDRNYESTPRIWWADRNDDFIEGLIEELYNMVYPKKETEMEAER